VAVRLQHTTGGADYRAVAVSVVERRKEPGLDMHVVVEEDHHLSRRLGETSVALTGQPRLTPDVADAQLPGDRARGLFRIAVDDDHLAGRRVAGEDVPKRAAQDVRTAKRHNENGEAHHQIVRTDLRRAPLGRPCAVFRVAYSPTGEQ
jgi:hypothetical protein